MSEKKGLAAISVSRTAVIVGIILFLGCLAAPFYSDPRVVWLVRLLLGIFGFLCVVLGLLAAQQERQRAHLNEDPDD